MNSKKAEAGARHAGKRISEVVILFVLNVEMKMGSGIEIQRSNLIQTKSQR